MTIYVVLGYGIRDMVLLGAFSRRVLAEEFIIHMKTKDSLMYGYSIEEVTMDTFDAGAAGVS